MSKHAVFSPSSSERWLNCPASVPLTMTVPEQESSDAAEEGTLAHGYVERLLNVELREYSTPKLKADLLKGILAEIECDDMTEHCQNYVEFVMRLRAQVLSKHKDKFFEAVEAKIKHSDPMFGTADYLLICGKTALVVDFKYGERTPVDAEESTQLQCYGLAVTTEYPAVETVLVVVYQPRSVFGERKTKGKYTRSELEKFDKTDVTPKIKQSLKLVKDGVDREHCIEGSWCGWCPASVVCPAKLEMIEEAIQTLPDCVEDASLSLLPMEKLVELYEKLPVLTKMVSACTKIGDYMQKQLLAAEPVPGYKLVTLPGRRSIRKDLDIKETKAYLKSLGVKKPTKVKETLLGVGDLEKALKVELKADPTLLDSIIAKPAPKPGLAKISDKRPDWTESLIGSFEDVTNELDE